MKRGYCFLHILLKQCENKTETIYTRAINYFTVESDCPSFMLVFIFSDSILFIEGFQVKVKKIIYLDMYITYFTDDHDNTVQSAGSNLGLAAGKLNFVGCEQQWRRTACTSAYADHRL